MCRIIMPCCCILLMWRITMPCLQDIVYQHSNPVKSVNICSRGHQFISLDQSSLHIWSRGLLEPDKVELHHIKALQQAHFVSAVCHATPAGLATASPILFAACLDNTLKVYAAEKLRLRSSMPWSGGIVTTILYNRCSCQALLLQWGRSARLCSHHSLQLNVAYLLQPSSSSSRTVAASVLHEAFLCGFHDSRGLA